MENNNKEHRKPFREPRDVNEQIQRRAKKLVKTDKDLIKTQSEGKGKQLSAQENGAVGGSIVQQAMKEFYENHPEVRKGRTWERRNRLREESLKNA